MKPSAPREHQSHHHFPISSHLTKPNFQNLKQTATQNKTKAGPVFLHQDSQKFEVFNLFNGIKHDYCVAN
ncbi:hypothetical protein GBA52_027999 [Prunus armeniaca]|nr:hypothetical protein GBA52_027999 [Prunus armeniaca]